MVYSWLGERMGEEHRRDLSILGGGAHEARLRPMETRRRSRPTCSCPVSGPGVLTLEHLRSGTRSGSTWEPC
jgi:hypothetical protein